MSHKRITACLAGWALALLVGATASAQGLSDMQLFAPPNLSTYGGPIAPNEGFFFTFDGLMWTISQPETSPIGHPAPHGRLVYTGPLEAQSFTQYNTHDTSLFGADMVTGTRYEMGFVHGHHGLIFSAWRLASQTQTINTRSMDMVFDDRPWGGALSYKHLDGYVDTALTIIRPLPVTFETARIRNRVRTWGLELEYLLRSNPMHSGGSFEFFGGARYLEFDDRFQVEAYGGEIPDPDDEDATIRTGVLADSFWYQDAKNHIVGPQVGARWFKRYGRWNLSTEGRFFAGFNSQSIYQTGQLGSELTTVRGTQGYPLSMGPTSFTHGWNENEWSPGIELRVMAEWQWTKSVALGVGWTGLWIDGIARACNMIDYKLDEGAMGILYQHNRQDVFMNGANFRIVINR